MIASVLALLPASAAGAVEASAITVSEPTRTSVELSWQTDVPSDATVIYGPTVAYGQAAYDGAFGTSHTVALADLECGTEYHYYVVSGAPDSAPAITLDATFVTQECDRPLSVIARQDSATVTWGTTAPARGTVVYGLDASYGNAAVEANDVTYHEVELVGLECGTTYLFSTLSDFGDGLVESSGAQSFTTYECEPFIDAVSVSSGETSATISWSTETAASSQVIWGPSFNYGNAAGGGAPVVSHRADLAGLQCGSVYHFRILSVDEAGFAHWSPASEFGTAPCAVDDPTAGPTGPVIGDAQVDATETELFVSWSTDVLAEGSVVWGTDPTYGNEARSSVIGDAHGVAIVDLDCGTSYELSILAIGADGLVSSSGNISANTAECGSTPPPAPEPPAAPEPDPAPPVDPETTAPSGAVVNTLVVSPGIDFAVIEFDTDVPADASVRYGLTNSYGTEVRSPAVGVGHRVDLVDLDCETVYNFRILATDGLGVVSGTDNGQFSTGSCDAPPAPPADPEPAPPTDAEPALPLEPEPAPPMEPAPPAEPAPEPLPTLTVSDIAVTDRTKSSATIMWNTSAVSDSLVVFGETSAYGQAVSAPALGMTHRIVLAGLECGTDYQFSALSTGETGLVGNSGNYVASTLPCEAADITDVEVQVGIDWAEIGWVTDVVADSTVIYGPSTAYGNAAYAPGEVTEHTVRIDGLDCGSDYNFRVVSNTAIDAPAFTPNGVFTTSSCEVDAPEGELDPVDPVEAPVPALELGGLGSSVPEFDATVWWSTNVPATSLVMYGTTEAYGEQVVADGDRSAHNVTLPGLACGTEYHYRAVSSAPDGSVVSTDDEVFTTSACGFF